MTPIEIFAITFATLALLLGICALILLYVKIKGSPPMPVDIVPLELALAAGFSRAMIDGQTSDLSQANHIGITIAEHPDGLHLWVNVDGANAFRAYKVKNLTIDDRRDWSMASAFKTAE